MTIDAWYTVWCDSCQAHDPTGGGSTKREAWRAAKQKGWKRRKVGNGFCTFCPSCAATHAALEIDNDD